MSSTEEAFIREKEEMGPKKVAHNNKKWSSKVENKKRELAKKIKVTENTNGR